MMDGVDPAKVRRLDSQDFMRTNQSSDGYYVVSIISFWLLSLFLVFALFKLVPVYREVYEGFGARVPQATLVAFNISSILTHYFPITFPAALGAIIGVHLLMGRADGKFPLFLFPLFVLVAVASLALAVFLPIFKMSCVG